MSLDTPRSRRVGRRADRLPTLAAILLAAWPGGAGASPWDDPQWRDSSRVMQLYICGDPNTRAEWCSELPGYRLAYDIVEYEADFGPPMPPDLARWHALIGRGDLGAVGPSDLRLIRRQATERADPLAMETLAYLYFNGIAVSRDLGEAYVWYARAALAGQDGAAANRDLVWTLLVRENPVAARRLVERFKTPEAATAQAASSARSEGEGTAAASRQVNADAARTPKR